MFFAISSSRLTAVLLLAAVMAFHSAPARAAEEPTEEATADEGKSPWLAAALTGAPALAGYGMAMGLAAGNDFDPAPLFFSGLALGLIGPAAGHIYLGRNPQHAVAFGLGRLGSVGVALLGIGDLLSHDSIQALNHESSGKANKGVDYALIGLGISGVVGLTVWEAIDSYACAHVTHSRSNGVALAPFLVPATPGRLASGGAMLAGRF